MKAHDYAVQIVWSKEDQAYIASTFELAGCVADGQTPEEALANLRVVIDEWIEVAKEEQRKVPPPLSCEDFDRYAQAHAQKQAEELRQQIEKAVNDSISEAIPEILRQLAANRIQRARFHEFSWPESETTTLGRR